MKDITLPSTSESDKLAFDDWTGHHISCPTNRNAAVAKLLGIPFVWCILTHRDTQAKFVQIGGTDKRNNMAAYRVVPKEYWQAIDKIQRAPIQPNENVDSWYEEGKKYLGIC